MTRNCPGCNLPMIYGQAFNGLLKCHWDCQDVVRAQLGEEETMRQVRNRASQRLKQDGLYEGHPVYDKLMAQTMLDFNKL